MAKVDCWIIFGFSLKINWVVTLICDVATVSDDVIIKLVDVSISLSLTWISYDDA